MTILIGTSENGGTFHTQGRAIAELLNRRDGPGGNVAVTTSDTASVGNARALEAGEINFGCMASNWIGRALAATPPFESPIDIRMVAPLNAGPLFFIAQAGSGLRAVDDIRGKRLAIGLEHSGMTQHVRTMFGVLGLSFDDFTPVWLGFADGADALAAGEVDAQFQCPIPNRVMTDLSERADIRVLSFAPDQIALLLAEVPYYRRVTMPAGEFRGLDTDSEQIGVLNVLVTHASADDAVVGRVARAMCDGAAELAGLNPLFQGLGDLFEPLRSEGAAALEPGGVPLHPGALAAYRSGGYIS